MQGYNYVKDNHVFSFIYTDSNTTTAIKNMNLSFL